MDDLKTDIFIFREFDDELLRYAGEDFIKSASQLYGEAPRINLWINSHGGYTHVLRTFLDGIALAKSRGVEVATYVTGAAYSCGSMLAAAGTPGLRFMGRTSHHLLHLGWTGAEGTNPVELSRDVARGHSHFEFVFQHYRKYAKVPQLRAKLQDDNLFVDFQTAVEWGLADHPLGK